MTAFIKRTRIFRSGDQSARAMAMRCRCPRKTRAGTCGMSSAKAQRPSAPRLTRARPVVPRARRAEVDKGSPPDAFHPPAGFESCRMVLEHDLDAARRLSGMCGRMDGPKKPDVAALHRVRGRRMRG